PLSLDTPGEAEARGIAAGRTIDDRRASSDVERNQEIAVAHAAFRRDDGASARCEPDARRTRLAPLGDAIGIAGEDGPSKFHLRDRRPTRGLRRSFLFSAPWLAQRSCKQLL